MVGLPEVVTLAKLDSDRFGHFCVVEVEFQVFPLTLVVVLSPTGLKALLWLLLVLL